MSRPQIRLLDPITINQIAAGEVIEQSASVLKELLENSIDAGATAIQVDLTHGGRTLLRVADNGCGLLPEEIPLALSRHATSKLTSLQDFDQLHTLGFRGEALASIASIARLSITSATEDRQGCQAHFEAGLLTSQSTASRSLGTTIEVRDLFFNVPVRQRFQKSISSDTTACIKVMRHIALLQPQLHLQLRADGVERLHLIARANSLEGQQLRLQDLVGSEWKPLVSRELTEGAITLRLFLPPPHLHKPHRSEQVIAINHRVIHHPSLSAAVRNAFGPRLDQGRYPLFALLIQVPPEWVDVNVHPQKKEVRLRKEPQLMRAIFHMVTDALASHDAPHAVPSPAAPTRPTSPPLWEAWEERSQQRIEEETLRPSAPLPPPLPPPPPPRIAPPELFSLPHVLCRLGPCLLLSPSSHPFWTSSEERLWLVDLEALQRADTESRLQHASEAKEPSPLLFPIPLEAPLTASLTPLQPWGFLAQKAPEGLRLTHCPAGMSSSEAAHCAELLLNTGTINPQFWRALRSQGMPSPSAESLLARFTEQQWTHCPLGCPLRLLLASTDLRRLLQPEPLTSPCPETTIPQYSL